ncbi:hypothetical protein CF319_g2646 [Tilletia indica]|uniref:Uncharacterized protein n=2 Tax=Tilletia TaxID=13289 RepID=A0A8X7NDF2_9BASI|nr:hypothetical protein CF327_g1370 [Tilletia walkeri]KAE8224462.1 hypothetical protein CF319_g2646 [Tilletia indica]KAE8234765.1 hypothetical protein CF326_g192 [Tilletia indica]KAE8258907.1 hypothetical protein A4X13_0g1363 [Tilletia indica]KAE8269965.1 hypothetical protein A4X09_0g2390 [Tilletia walkeri]
MSYTIAGRKILNEHIALGTFALYGVLGFAATAGGDKKAAGAAPGSSSSVREPALNASSSDEEAFIKQFLADAEGKNERLV